MCASEIQSGADNFLLSQKVYVCNQLHTIHPHYQGHKALRLNLIPDTLDV